MRVDHAIRGHCDVVGTYVVEDGLGVGTRYQNLAKATLVDQTDTFADRPVLRGRVLEPVLSSVRVRVTGLDTVRCVPVGPLPAHRLPKAGAPACKPVVQRRLTDPPSGFILAKWPVHVVEQPKAFDDPLLQITGITLEGQHAANIDLPEIHAGIAVDDPFGQHLAGTPRGPDPDRVEPAGDVKIPELRRLAQQIAIVRCKAFRPAEKCLDPRFRKSRNAVQREFENGFEMIPVVGKLIE